MLPGRCQRLPTRWGLRISPSAHGNTVVQGVARKPQPIALTVAIDWRKVVVNVDGVASGHGDRDLARSKRSGGHERGAHA